MEIREREMASIQAQAESPVSLWVTGGTGFIGQALLAAWQSRPDWKLRAVSLRQASVEDLEGPVDAVLHLAGLAHQMSGAPDSEYQRVNAALTLALARHAKALGARQFLFVSTVKVHGESSLPGSPLTEASPRQPLDAYGRSKAEAEEGLQVLADETFAVTILRIPLVCGPGVKGNLRRVIDLVRKIPLLPLGGIENRRSLLTLTTLRQALERLIESRMGGTFLIADHPALSTSELVRRIGRASGRVPLLLPLPSWLRRLAEVWRPALATRLFGSLELDDRSTRARLGMSEPDVDLLEDAIAGMVRASRTPPREEGGSGSSG